MQHVRVCALHPLCVQNVCACSVRAMHLQYMHLQCMYEVCACSVHTVCMQHVHVRVMCMQYVRVHAVCVPQARLTDTCMQCAYRMHAIRVCVCSVRTARMQNVCTQRTPALPAPAGIHYVGQMHEGSMLRVVVSIKNEEDKTQRNRKEGTTNWGEIFDVNIIDRGNFFIS